MILVFHEDVALARYYNVIHMDILHHRLQFVPQEVLYLANCIAFWDAPNGFSWWTHWQTYSDITTLPVWINLLGLPLHCWNPRALSEIVSMVGKPILTNKLTYTKENLSHARLLVEIDVSEELVKSIQMKFPTRKTRNQGVIYEHIPKFCGVCKMFGHSTPSCNANKISKGRNEAGLNA